MIHVMPPQQLSVPLARTLPAAFAPAVAVRRLRDQGFLVVPPLCDDTELEHIGSLLRKLFLQQAGRDEGNQLDMLSLDRQAWDATQPQIVKPSLYAPALLQTMHFRRVQALARQLLGVDAQFSFDHCILKPAGKVAATPWHQDEAHNHNPHFYQKQISFWMPLQDTGVANGCMHYIPGSNLGPLLPHRSLDGDPRIHALECLPGHFNVAAAVAQPVPSGWCILHTGRTLHGALPNRSDSDRLAYVLVFRSTPVMRDKPLYLSWLATQRTASLERGLLWRSHGGFLVLMLRSLRRMLSSDTRALRLKLRSYLQLSRASLRQWRRHRPGR